MTESATFAAEVGSIKDMINRSALSGDDQHDDLYLEVSDDEVKVLQSAPGDSVLTFSSFYDSYFERLSVDGDDPLGAIIRVEQTLGYLDMVSDSGVVELTFTLDKPEDATARHLTFEGDFEGGVVLPGGREALSRVPDWLPERFTDDNVYTSSPEAGSKELPTTIETRVDDIRHIIGAKDQVGAKTFPIVVDDGEFILDIGHGDSYVRGPFDIQDVEGPDVDNQYLSGFEEIFNVLTGRITLRTAPGNGPLAVVKDGAKSVVRHVNASVNTD